MQKEREVRMGLPDLKEIEAGAQRLRKIHAERTGANWTKSRSLTEAEWQEVKTIITVFSFPTVLMHTGLGFALIVYDHAPIPESNLEHLLSMDDGEFPFESSQQGFAGQLKTLRTLEPLTHSKRNAEVLAWYRQHPLSPVESYVY